MHERALKSELSLSYYFSHSAMITNCFIIIYLIQFLTGKRLNQQRENPFTSKEDSAESPDISESSYREPLAKDADSEDIFLCTHRPAQRQPC